MSRFVVVSGLPASGKSTVAKALAAQLGVPLLDKDAYLEALYESEGTGNLHWRRQLSQRADTAFEEGAKVSAGAVLTSWWKHPLSALESGTPTEWLAALPGIHIEVHCKCSPKTAAARFARQKRHPGHLDDRWSHTALLAALEQQEPLGPLGFGTLIEVHTEGTLSLQALFREIESVSRQSSDK